MANANHVPVPDAIVAGMKLSTPDFSLDVVREKFVRECRMFLMN
jgi:hypothetical protein